jgi:hypothetical protein
MAGVNRTCRFNQQNMTFIRGHRSMLHAFWHNEHFTFIQAHVSIAELNLELTFQDNERFIGLRMVMPDKLSLNLCNLEVVLIHLRHDLRRPVLGEQGQFLLKVNRLKFIG